MSVPSCMICDHQSHSLIGHLKSAHGLTAGEYLELHPGAPTVSERLLAEARKGGGRRTPVPAPEGLKVSLMGFEAQVDAGVDPKDILPLPESYAFPTKGKAKAAYERVLMALLGGRSGFIWGMPGTGKDALVHAFSAMTYKPVVMLTFRPGTDLAPWFYSRAIGAEGTSWEYGHLWRALTEGVKGRDGVYRPALILLSDVDRADSSQVEWFRILTDSISGRILSPTGEMVPILRGTQFVATANSCGSGDSRGRMASAQTMDASVLDRFVRKFRGEYMDWEDEGKVLLNKYPLLAQLAPWIFFTPEGKPGELGNATKAIREAVDRGTLYCEFTMRGLDGILQECEDIIRFRHGGKTAPSNLLKHGFRAWLDGLDEDTQLEARRTVDPHVGGGALE